MINENSQAESKKTIIVTVTHPTKTDFEGFQSFWSRHVRGCDETKHCIECLKGPEGWSQKREKILLNNPIHVIMKGNYYYICGLCSKADDDYNDNFHFAVKWKEGATAELVTYNGFTFSIENAERIKFGGKEVNKKFTLVSKENEDFENGKLGYDYLSCRIYWFIHKVFAEEIAARQK